MFSPLNVAYLHFDLGAWCSVVATLLTPKLDCRIHENGSGMLQELQSLTSSVPGAFGWSLDLTCEIHFKYTAIELVQIHVINCILRIRRGRECNESESPVLDL